MNGLENDFPPMIKKHCEVCQKTDGLLRCGGCYVYYYCNREHQVKDRPVHKTTCRTLKDTESKVKEEEAKLRARSAGDDELPPDALGCGRLWLFKPGRPYLQAMFLRGEMLIRSWRQQGIEDALDLYLKMLQLNAADNQGARYVIPALCMRLGRNQEAYDFIKGWGLQYTGKPEARQLEDPCSAYLHVKNADATEAVELWTASEWLELPFVASLALIKMRLLLGLQHLVEFRTLLPQGASMPSAKDVFAHVHGKYCDDVFERMPELYGDDELIAKTELELSEQLKDLFVAINNYNKHFWPMMLHPEERDMTGGTQIYTPRSREEARFSFMHVYPAWCETPMAFDLARATIQLSVEGKPE